MCNNLADGFGYFMPTRECGPHGREPRIEFQMRNTTFTSSMVGIAAAVAVASSASAAIVSGPGGFSDCATFNPSTSTTITYTIVALSNSTFGTFSMGFGVLDASNNGYTAGIEVTNIEYSTDSGTNWTLGASSYTTGNTTYSQFVGAAPGSAAWAFSFTDNGSVGSDGGIDRSTLRVRATLSATSSIPNDYQFYGFQRGQYSPAGNAFAGATFSTAVPAPGALALLGAAGLVGARRRRA
ncbi:MAG: hypothetical protein RIR77_1912 [Planctomycetota bacterium]